MEEKKKKTTKTVAKKETKKKVEEAPKKEVKKEEASGTFKEFISSYKFLYTTFGILFVIVVLLALMVFTKSNEAQEKNSNIVFSIMEENTRNSLNMDLESLVGNEYTLKVSNNRSGKIATKIIDYSITIVNNTDVELEVLANNEGDNLITDQKKAVIHGDGFGITQEEEIIYYFRVKNSDKLKKGDSIQIIVES